MVRKCNKRINLFNGLILFLKENLNGTIIKSYMACKRQGWLASRKLTPLVSNVFIQTIAEIFKPIFDRTIFTILNKKY